MKWPVASKKVKGVSPFRLHLFPPPCEKPRGESLPRAVVICLNSRPLIEANRGHSYRGVFTERRVACSPPVSSSS